MRALCKVLVNIILQRLSEKPFVNFILQRYCKVRFITFWCISFYNALVKNPLSLFCEPHFITLWNVLVRNPIGFLFYFKVLVSLYNVMVRYVL